jgi:hypothetical protein
MSKPRKLAKARAQKLNKELDRVRLALIIATTSSPLAFVSMLVLQYLTLRKHSSQPLTLGYATFSILCIFSVFLIHSFRKRNLANAALDDQIAFRRKTARDLAVLNALIFSVSSALIIYSLVAKFLARLFDRNKRRA